jgi:hypothetical protein
MTAQEAEELQEFMIQVQRRFGISIPLGYNKNLQHMGHLSEDLNVAFKPLFVHVAFEIVNLWSSILLTMIGFRKYHTPTFAYWGRSLERPVTRSSMQVSSQCITLFDDLC